MKYGFIRTHAERWPVVHLGRLLGVQRSAYYDWRDQSGKDIAHSGDSDHRFWFYSIT